MFLKIDKRKMIQIRLREKREVAEDTLLYVFDRPNNFSFLAGQYVSMKVIKKSFQDERGDFRSFSIASPPYKEDVLEFAMRRSESAFKKNLESLEVGEYVEITQAVGKCVFGEPDPEKGIVFLVGGVGVTPARSMLLQAEYEKRPEKFFFFNSNRYPESAPFLEEFDQLNKINIVRVYTMTDRNLPGKPWSGERERVNREMLKRYVHMDLTRCTFFIVGIGMFVQAVRDMLLGEGVSLGQIFSDDFGGVKK